MILVSRVLELPVPVLGESEVSDDKRFGDDENLEVMSDIFNGNAQK